MSRLISTHLLVIVVTDTVCIVTGPKDTALNGQQIFFFLLLLDETFRLYYQLQMHLFRGSHTHLAIQGTMELLHMTFEQK